ncbi:unnamed protein product [Coregonus sp. 'balchen']|nr:unnamed protein product [Coregonus sp. 'balchen']
MAQVEESHRKMVWKDNMRFIDQHNLEAAESNYTYTLRMNHIGDMGQVYRKTGRLCSLSAKNLLDCTRTLGNMGCKEGRIALCYEMIRKYEIMSETGYPYSPKEYVSRDTRDFLLTTKEHMRDSLYNVGPVTVYVNLSSRTFQVYHAAGVPLGEIKDISSSLEDTTSVDSQAVPSTLSCETFLCRVGVNPIAILGS